MNCQPRGDSKVEYGGLAQDFNVEITDTTSNPEDWITRFFLHSTVEQGMLIFFFSN